jgi:hypothetical protein
MAASNTRIDPTSVQWDRPAASAIKWDGAPTEAGPSPLGSDGENFRAAVGRGMYSAARGAKQRLDEVAALLEKYTPGADAVNRFMGGPTAAQIRDEGQAEVNEQRRLDAPLMATKAGKAGDLLGGVVAGSVLPGGPIAQGMALGYTTPTAGDESVLKNTGLGALGGYLGDKVVRGVSRVISPKIAPEVRQLADAGVTMTPGQLMGGVANSVEQKATSLPFVGDAIANARRRSVTDFNRAAINRALEPIGDALPKKLPAGREAIQYADDALGAAYDKLLPKLTTQADTVFVQDIQQLRGMVQGGNMGPQEAQQFNRLLQDKVLSKFMGQQAITGQTMKQMESELGRLGRGYMGDPSADKRALGGAILELQGSLRSLVQRSNPQYADELSRINKGWANFKRVERAAGSVGAPDGVFSPAQLQNSVKALDRSKDKGSFSKGSALMQDLSESGKNVLGSTVPDSGTPGRLMNVGALGAGSYGLLSGAVSPLAPAAMGLGMGAYTAPMQRLIQAALLNRPKSASLLAADVERLAPYIGLLGGAAAPQLGQ